jgi:hypothetical protein
MKSRLNRAAVRVFDIVDGEHVSIDSEQLTLLGRIARGASVGC